MYCVFIAWITYCICLFHAQTFSVLLSSNSHLYDLKSYHPKNTNVLIDTQLIICDVIIGWSSNVCETNLMQILSGIRSTLLLCQRSVGYCMYWLLSLLKPCYCLVKIIISMHERVCVKVSVLLMLTPLAVPLYHCMLMMGWLFGVGWGFYVCFHTIGLNSFSHN